MNDEKSSASASERARELQANLDELQTCIEVGNEERFVELVKLGKPGIDLNAMIEEFRSIRRNRSRR